MAERSEKVCGSKKMNRFHAEPWMTILHGDERSSFYYHLGKVLVKERELLKRGQIIAYKGPTGYSSPNRNQMISYPQLQLEININGNRANQESLRMICPNPNNKWWWPVGCENGYKKLAEK
jgi:murein DD-endopeptidase MepM/ murein hydrolase activator NlpD